MNGDSRTPARYPLQRLLETGLLPEVEDAEAADDVGCCGLLRGIRDRAVMLELRKRDGTVLAVNYGWIERLLFDPSAGITLTVKGESIRIQGQNLNADVRPNIPLFSAITRHRILWISEATKPETMRAITGSILIETISW